MLTPQQKQKLIIECLRNQNKYQINAMHDAVIQSEGIALSLSAVQINELKTLQASNLLSNEKIKEEFLSIDKIFNNLFNAWNGSELKNLRLTTVGIALAHANIKKNVGDHINLGDWIK